jgi:hypothetical protein
MALLLIWSAAPEEPEVEAGSGEPAAPQEDAARPEESDPPPQTGEEPAPEAAETSEPVLDPRWYRDSDDNVVPDFLEAEAEAYDLLFERVNAALVDRERARDEAARRAEELREQYFELREQMSAAYGSTP